MLSIIYLGVCATLCCIGFGLMIRNRRLDQKQVRVVGAALTLGGGVRAKPSKRGKPRPNGRVILGYLATKNYLLFNPWFCANLYLWDAMKPGFGKAQA